MDQVRESTLDKVRRYLPPSEVDFVIYHYGCPDGFGGAYCLWSVIGGALPEKRGEINNGTGSAGVTYYGASHHQEPPDVTGKNVCIVDFSYKREILEKMATEANRLIVLDHHVSAQRDLEGFPNTVFDMNRSGAMLAWNYCYSGEGGVTSMGLKVGRPTPMLIRYIQDRDIWTWKEPNSLEFSAGFSEEPFEFSVFDRYAKNVDNVIERTIEKGRVILDYCKIQRERMLRGVQLRRLANKTVAVLNSNIWMSELGNEMSLLEIKKRGDDGEKTDENVDIDCALVWYWDHYNKICKCSLRGVRDDVDVSVIAGKFGGGGHAKAAGFTWDHPIEELFDDFWEDHV